MKKVTLFSGVMLLSTGLMASLSLRAEQVLPATATPMSAADIRVTAGLAIVTHKNSPVGTLAPEQVRALFNGHVRAFPQTSDMVTLIDHPMESDRYRDFYQLLFNSPPERIQRRRAAYLFSGKGILPDTALSDEDVISRVAKNRLSIGYVDSGQVDDRVRVVCRLPPE
jgi:ABC-type phosphate transport system substrate-binding protein